MRVLILGNGGREHALAWKIAASPLSSQIYIAPGNPGTAEVGENVACNILEPRAVVGLVNELKIDLLVIGPESALAAGVTDAVLEEVPQCRVFGPTKAGARLEWSKAFAKDFMNRHAIPTAQHHHFSSSEEAKAYLESCVLPVVAKADGLAAGKGVVVAKTRAEAVAAVDALPKGQHIVVEEFLQGRELSVLAITDGRVYHLLLPVRDYKALNEGNKGPNTGGMGACAPVSEVTGAELEEIKSIADKTLYGLIAEGIDYRGIIYLGLMMTAEGVKVLEYNARFGDPECQVLVSLMESDLLLYLVQAAEGDLPDMPLEWRKEHACLVVNCGEHYPQSGSFGLPIAGVEQARALGCLVFHAGTALSAGQLVTGGGRVLNVLGRHADMKEARQLAYRGIAATSFSGMRYRADIGEGEAK